MKTILVLTVASFLALAKAATADETVALEDYAGAVATIATFDNEGRPTRVQDVDGSTIDLYYDAAGCLDRTVRNDGTIDEYECDANGNAIPSFFAN